MNKNVTKEILQDFSRDRLIEYALELTEGSSKVYAHRLEDLEKIDLAIEYILEGEYKQAIMVLLEFYEGYIPDYLMESMVSKYYARR